MRCAVPRSLCHYHPFAASAARFRITLYYNGRYRIGAPLFEMKMPTENIIPFYVFRDNI